MKKMNNKGFSLVELIVVVLIMAIIAVALAPQVMKWVENSRKSTDIENYNALVEAANVAAADENVIALVCGANGDRFIKMTQNGTSLETQVSSETTGALYAKLGNVLPNWTTTKISAGEWKTKTFWIAIKKSGDGIAVTRGGGSGHETAGTDYPVKDFS